MLEINIVRNKYIFFPFFIDINTSCLNHVSHHLVNKYLSTWFVYYTTTHFIYADPSLPFYWPTPGNFISYRINIPSYLISKTASRLS